MSNFSFPTMFLKAVSSIRYAWQRCENHQSRSYAIVDGFSNWKDACGSFRKHETSKCHQELVLTVETLPRYSGDIGEKNVKETPQ